MHHNDNLRTTDIGLLIPKIVNKYGSKYVDFYMTILPYSKAEIGTDAIRMSTNYKITISSLGEEILRFDYTGVLF